MKRRLLLVLLIAVCVCVLAYMSVSGPPEASAAHEPVQAKLSSESGDHAPVFVGEAIDDSFFIINTGNRPFRIASVKSSCACTNAVMTKGYIKPGERGQIDYAMHSTSPVQKAIAIHVQTDPALDKPLVFMAKGSWKSIIEVDPAAATMDSEFGKPILQRVPLRAAAGAGPFKITRVSARHNDFSVTYEPPAEGSDTLGTLLVKSTDVVQPGRKNVTVFVTFKRSEQSVQVLNLVFNIHSDFEVSPKPIIVTLKPEDPKPTVPITVTNTKGTPFLIESIQPERFDIRRPDLPKSAATSQTVPITFDLANGPAPRRGNLLVDLGKANGTLSLDVFFAQPPAR